MVCTSSDEQRLAIFDCDGTLVDSQEGIVAAMNSAFETVGASPPAADDILRVVGLPLAECLRRLSPSLSDNQQRIMAETYNRSRTEQRRRGDLLERVFVGVASTLTAMKGDGWKLAVATGKSSASVALVLERHQLSGLFDAVASGDQGRGKPHPDMIHQIRSKIDAPSHRTMMIGDTTFDMRMAVAAGVHPIGVNWGYHASGELKLAGAHRVVLAFEDIPRAAVECLAPGCQ